MSLTSVRVSWQGLLKQPECADNIVVRTFRSVATTRNASTFLNNFDTGWSRETVTLNFSRMELKSTNDGLPQWNLGRFWYFDVSKGPGEKNPVFQGCAKVVCFPAWLGHSALKGRVLTFFTNGVNHVIHLINLGGRSTVLMTELNICDFRDLQGPKIDQKWLKMSTERNYNGQSLSITL